MHLVDAIRMAAKKAEESHKPEEAISMDAASNHDEETQAVANVAGANTEGVSSPSDATLGTAPDTSDYHPMPVNPAVHTGAGSVVRLELFLTPEQMHQMLRSILHGSHTVMTLREASQYLRVTGDALTHLAEAGDIPAFMVEGRWKFTRQAVDEWMTLQTLQKRHDGGQEHDNAA